MHQWAFSGDPSKPLMYLKEKETKGMNGRSEWFKNTLESAHLVSYSVIYLIAFREVTYFFLSLNFMICRMGRVIFAFVAN